MPLFPVAAVVLILMDGRAVSANAGAFDLRGRVFAPVSPYLTQVADRLWYDGDTLVIERDGRIARVRIVRRAPDALQTAYVDVAPVLRQLGLVVTYVPEFHALDIVVPSAVEIATPEPFDPAAPQVTPWPVFTPMPPTTPRPVWSGPPTPRRTPLPFPP